MPDAGHRILLVEDDAGIRESLQDVLEGEGYLVTTAEDGLRAFELGTTEDPDLVVLDVMLPGMDGFEVLRRLRDDGVETPVILLTARALERDRVRGLDLGADDYVVKPFALQELLARIRSRLRAWDREREGDRGEVLRLGDLVVDLRAREASRDGTPVHLTPKEIDLLQFLATNEGRAISRGELLREVWSDEDVTSRVVDTAILGLRKKVEIDPSSPRFVLGVRGFGYRFVRRAAR